jgi:hypothetical protein
MRSLKACADESIEEQSRQTPVQTKRSWKSLPEGTCGCVRLQKAIPQLHNPAI